MTRLFIIADDLTGALDSAASFADRGASVRVARSPADLPEALDSRADVVAVATGTRDGSEARARTLLTEVRQQLAGCGGLMFKKIDSRLKGHVAAELDTLLADRTPPLIVSPAIPALGRFCIGGAVTGAGVASPIAVAPVLGREALILDAESDDDLDRQLPQDLEGSVLVGAAGLAAALAKRLFPAPATTRDRVRLPAPALIAIGSRDPVTMAQVAALDGVTVHEAPNGAVPPLSPAALRIVCMTPGRDTIAPDAAGRSFAAGITRALRDHPAATLVVCGGESAGAILDGLGIGQLDLQGEVLPGVPRSTAQILGGTLEIITKSGGFGPPDTVVKLVTFVDMP